ncbi:YceD family protein [Actinomyces sp. F1_1611]
MSAKELQISLIDLPAEVGAHLEKTVDWVVPSGWSTGVLTLEEGQHLPVTVSLTALEDGVFVQVSAQGQLVGECVRCLDPVSVDFSADAGDIYVEGERSTDRKAHSGSADEIEVEGDDLDPVKVINRDTVDIEPLLRDAVFADAPLQPVCDDDCQGLCPQCGRRMDELEPGHHHEFTDPRFAALEGFFAAGDNEDE